MGKYNKEAQELLTLVGGRENIAEVTHCMTRMRFVLHEPQRADVAGIEKMKSVKGCVMKAPQLQVIIGNGVADFYGDFMAAEETTEKETMEKQKNEKQKEKNNSLRNIMAILAEIIAPLIPAIITGGLMLGLRDGIAEIKALHEVSQFWTELESLLQMLSEVIFRMLPVGICWSVTKKMGTTQILGIVLGLTLTSGQIFPALLSSFVLVFLEKFFRKVIPQSLSMIVVPFCSLLLSAAAARYVLEPIGIGIGNAISTVVYSGMTGPFRAVFGAAVGFGYTLLVMTGFHHISNLIDLQLIADYGGTMLWPMIALSNIAQGFAVFGMLVLQRKDAKARQVNASAGISCCMGVTEPAVFGVNAKHRFPLVCGMIGSAAAGILCASSEVTANAIGVGGVLGILSIRMTYIGSFAIAMAAAAVISFVLTLLVGKKRGRK